MLIAVLAGADAHWNGISHEGGVLHRVGHGFIDFGGLIDLLKVLALVVREHLLVNKLLELLLVLQKNLLIGTGLLEHSHVKNVAVLAPILV